MMLATLLAAMLSLQAPAWTWTLYEGSGPIVLANEAPDTPELKTTFECVPGSAIARVSLYGGQIASGFANISAGDDAATGQAEAGRDGQLIVAVRTDHPVFSAFVSSGALSVTVADVAQAVVVQPAHLAKLRRFADLCSG